MFSAISYWFAKQGDYFLCNPHFCDAIHSLNPIGKNVLGKLSPVRMYQSETFDASSFVIEVPRLHFEQMWPDVEIKTSPIFFWKLPKELPKEPWSSGYGRRLVFQRMGVQILASYNGWTFFTYLFVVKLVMCVWKDENKWKRGQDWPNIF